METLVDVRSAAAIVGVLLVLVVAGIVVARLLRARASRMPLPGPPPMPTPEPPPAGSDAAYLDSSHIISGPLLGAAEGRSDVAGGAAANDGGPGTRNGPGPRQ